jgi:hypothetical protein
MDYLIQFVAGSGALVRECLERVVDAPRITYADESAMLFGTPKRLVTAQLPFANNVFQVLARTRRKNLTSSIDRLTEMVHAAEFPRFAGRDRPFRVMFHIDGALVQVDGAVRAGLQREIAACTGMSLQARGSGEEFWVIGRKDLAELLLCWRLSKRKRPDRPKGALSDELSTMLVVASRPRPGDTFLDPFGGSGALLLARLDAPGKAFLYADTVRHQLPRALRIDRRVRLVTEDARFLPSVGDGEVDAIVTDPPWGEHQELGQPYHEFASAVARSFDRVLDPRVGRFVLLSSRRNAATWAASLKGKGLRIASQPEILVNGHPATVLIGGRPR